MNQEERINRIKKRIQYGVASTIIVAAIIVFLLLLPAPQIKITQEANIKSAPLIREPASAIGIHKPKKSTPNQYWVLVGAPLLLYIGKRTTDLVFEEIIRPKLRKRLSDA